MIEVISVFANLMTIIGVGLAMYVAAIWKAQQNYSFVRDKIFELEIAVSELFNYEQHLIINITNALINNRDGQHDQNIHAKVDEITSRKYLRDRLLQYDLKLSSIKILKVKIDAELFVHGIEIQNLIDEKMKIFFLPENKPTIELLRNDLISKMEESQKLMLEHLEVVRKAI